MREVVQVIVGLFWLLAAVLFVVVLGAVALFAVVFLFLFMALGSAALAARLMWEWLTS